MVSGFYNIYIGENLLQLVITSDLPFISLKVGSQELVDYDADHSLLLSSILKLEKNEKSRIVVSSSDLDNLWKEFNKICIPVVAAGGLVLNQEEEILAIFRRKSWDLPKGKIEQGEKKKAAAVREVKEECGLTNAKIVGSIGVTYHTFGSKDKRKLKISYWYLMTSTDRKLVPQTDEDIEIAKWISVQDFILTAKPVYPNIMDVIEAYILKKSKLLSK